MPVSSNYLFDYINDYENNYPEKYNKCFNNHNIPEEHNINIDYLNNILVNNNINNNTLIKCINQLRKKSNLSLKISEKINENNSINNILKEKISKMNKNNVSINNLNKLMETINLIKYEKQNLEKLNLLNKYLYLNTIDKIYTINNDKHNINQNCNQLQNTLNNDYNISPTKFSKLQKTLTDFDKYISKQHGGNISDDTINNEMKNLSPKIQKAYEYFKVKDDSSTQLKLLENKLQSICKGEKDVNKCIDRITNKLTDFTDSSEQIKELEQNLENTEKILKQKENMLGQLENKTEADFMKFKDELGEEFKELEEIKNKEIDTFKQEIKDLSLYKNKYEEEYKKNKEHQSLIEDNDNEINILRAKVGALDGSKDTLLKEYNDLVNSENEHRLKYELKEKELDYINDMYSSMADREVKLQEKSLEYDKLKKDYDKIQDTIKEFSQNLDAIAKNKQKLLDRLRNLEDMNLLLSNSTFGKIFEEPINTSGSNDDMINDLNKRKSALENILNSFKYSSDDPDTAKEQKLRYKTYNNTINMFINAIDGIKNYVENNNFKRIQNTQRISSNLLYNNDIEEIHTYFIEPPNNWNINSINPANINPIITQVVTKLQIAEQLNNIQTHTNNFMKNKLGDPYNSVKRANIDVGVNPNDCIPNIPAGELLINIDGTHCPTGMLPVHLQGDDVNKKPDYTNAKKNGINSLKDLITIIYYHVSDLKTNPELLNKPANNNLTMNDINIGDNTELQQRLNDFIAEKNLLIEKYNNDLYQQIQSISMYDDSRVSQIEKEKLYNNARQTTNNNINNIDNILKIKFQVDPNVLNNIQKGGINTSFNQNNKEHNIILLYNSINKINEILNKPLQINIKDTNNKLLTNNKLINNIFLTHINNDYSYDKDSYNKNDILYKTWNALIDEINNEPIGNKSFNNIDIYDLFNKQLYKRISESNITEELKDKINKDIDILAILKDIVHKIKGGTDEIRPPRPTSTPDLRFKIEPEPSGPPPSGTSETPPKNKQNTMKIIYNNYDIFLKRLIKKVEEGDLNFNIMIMTQDNQRTIIEYLRKYINIAHTLNSNNNINSINDLFNYYKNDKYYINILYEFLEFDEEFMKHINTIFNIIGLDTIPEHKLGSINDNEFKKYIGFYLDSIEDEFNLHTKSKLYVILINMFKLIINNNDFSRFNKFMDNFKTIISNMLVILEHPDLGEYNDNINISSKNNFKNSIKIHYNIKDTDNKNYNTPKYGGRNKEDNKGDIKEYVKEEVKEEVKEDIINKFYEENIYTNIKEKLQKIGKYYNLSETEINNIYNNFIKYKELYDIDNFKETNLIKTELLEKLKYMFKVNDLIDKLYDLKEIDNRNQLENITTQLAGRISQQSGGTTPFQHKLSTYISKLKSKQLNKLDNKTIYQIKGFITKIDQELRDIDNMEYSLLIIDSNTDKGNSYKGNTDYYDEPNKHPNGNSEEEMFGGIRNNNSEKITGRENKLNILISDRKNKRAQKDFYEEILFTKGTSLHKYNIDIQGVLNLSNQHLLKIISNNIENENESPKLLEIINDMFNTFKNLYENRFLYNSIYNSNQSKLDKDDNELFNKYDKYIRDQIEVINKELEISEIKNKLDVFYDKLTETTKKTLKGGDEDEEDEAKEGKGKGKDRKGTGKGTGKGTRNYPPIYNYDQTKEVIDYYSPIKEKLETELTNKKEETTKLEAGLKPDSPESYDNKGVYNLLEKLNKKGEREVEDIDNIMGALDKLRKNLISIVGKLEQKIRLYNLPNTDLYVNKIQNILRTTIEGHENIIREVFERILQGTLPDITETGNGTGKGNGNRTGDGDGDGDGKGNITGTGNSYIHSGNTYLTTLNDLINKIDDEYLSHANIDYLKQDINDNKKLDVFGTLMDEWKFIVDPKKNESTGGGNDNIYTFEMLTNTINSKILEHNFEKNDNNIIIIDDVDLSNITDKFNKEFNNNNKFVLIYTGTGGNNNCLLYSLLGAISTEFIKLLDTDKKTIMNELIPEYFTRMLNEEQQQLITELSTITEEKRKESVKKKIDNIEQYKTDICKDIILSDYLYDIFVKYLNINILLISNNTPIYAENNISKGNTYFIYNSGNHFSVMTYGDEYFLTDVNININNIVQDITTLETPKPDTETPTPPPTPPTTRPQEIDDLKEQIKQLQERLLREEGSSSFGEEDDKKIEDFVKKFSVKTMKKSSSSFLVSMDRIFDGILNIYISKNRSRDNKSSPFDNVMYSLLQITDIKKNTDKFDYNLNSDLRNIDDENVFKLQTILKEIREHLTIEINNKKQYENTDKGEYNIQKLHTILTYIIKVLYFVFYHYNYNPEQLAEHDFNTYFEYVIGMIRYTFTEKSGYKGGRDEEIIDIINVKNGENVEKLKKEELKEKINEIVKYRLDKIIDELKFDELFKEHINVIDEIRDEITKKIHTGGNGLEEMEKKILEIKNLDNELGGKLDEIHIGGNMMEIQYEPSSMYDPPEIIEEDIEENIKEIVEDNKEDDKNKMEIFKNTSVVKMLKNLYKLHLKGKDKEAEKMMESILLELINILNKLYKYETKMGDINKKYVSKYKVLLQDTLKLKIDKTECEEGLNKMYNNNFKNQNNLFEEYDRLGVVIPRELLLI